MVWNCSMCADLDRSRSFHVCCMSAADFPKKKQRPGGPPGSGVVFPVFYIKGPAKGTRGLWRGRGQAGPECGNLFDVGRVFREKATQMLLFQLDYWQVDEQENGGEQNA